MVFDWNVLWCVVDSVVCCCLFCCWIYFGCGLIVFGVFVLWWSFVWLVFVGLVVYEFDVWYCCVVLFGRYCWCFLCGYGYCCWWSFVLCLCLGFWDCFFGVKFGSIWMCWWKMRWIECVVGLYCLGRRVFGWVCCLFG